MAIFKSGNPTLTEKIFNNSLTAEANAQGIMSVRGTLNKFGFLMLMVIGGAFYTWHTYQSGQPGTTTTLMMVGVFGGLIAAIAIMFKPMWAGYIAPAYGILEGLFIGAISAMINDMYVCKKLSKFGTTSSGLNFWCCTCYVFAVQFQDY